MTRFHVPEGENLLQWEQNGKDWILNTRRP